MISNTIAALAIVLGILGAAFIGGELAMAQFERECYSTGGTFTDGGFFGTTWCRY